jgi:hypothetical protein
MRLTNIIEGTVARWDNAHLWGGVLRGAAGVATVALILRPREWSLPLSISYGSHIICRPGVTIGLGPLYLSWGWV